MKNISFFVLQKILEKGLEGEVLFSGHFNAFLTRQVYSSFFSYRGQMSLVKDSEEDNYTLSSLLRENSEFKFKKRGNIVFSRQNSEFFIPININLESGVSFSSLKDIKY